MRRDATTTPDVWLPWASPMSLTRRRRSRRVLSGKAVARRRHQPRRPRRRCASAMRRRWGDRCRGIALAGRRSRLTIGSSSSSSLVEPQCAKTHPAPETGNPDRHECFARPGRHRSSWPRKSAAQQAEPVLLDRPRGRTYRSPSSWMRASAAATPGGRSAIVPAAWSYSMRRSLCMGFSTLFR